VAILPTHTLSGTGGTVDFSRKHGPEELQYPSEVVGTEIRRCMAEDEETPGAVYLLTEPYQLAGQTMTTSHRIITEDQHEKLLDWNRSKEILALVLTLPSGTLNASVVITSYKPKPRNVKFRWATQIVVDELTLLFVEDE
jgi:hypothetical protein